MHVHEKNCKKNIDQAYIEVFQEQEDSGVIERIQGEYNPNDHIWMVHQAVCREDPLCTTKVRPVFNCSLKTKGYPSLNEAAYPGSDLMTPLMSLI